MGKHYKLELNLYCWLSKLKKMIGEILLMKIKFKGVSVYEEHKKWRKYFSSTWKLLSGQQRSRWQMSDIPTYIFVVSLSSCSLINQHSCLNFSDMNNFFAELNFNQTFIYSLLLPNTIIATVHCLWIWEFHTKSLKPFCMEFFINNAVCFIFLL